MKNKIGFRMNEKFFTGITLGKDDIIKLEGYSRSGVKVSTFLKRYGKEGVMELLHYYDLEDEILNEYHIHKLTPEEKEKMDIKEMNKVQKSTNETVPVEETYENTLLDIEEEYPDQDDYWNYPLMYDPEDEDVFEYPWGIGQNKFEHSWCEW